MGLHMLKAGAVWIDGRVGGSVARYANDTRGTQWTYNVRMCEGGEWGKKNASGARWGATFEAITNIEAGQELYVDYGALYWQRRRKRGSDARAEETSRMTRATTSVTIADAVDSDGRPSGTTGTTTSATAVDTDDGAEDDECQGRKQQTNGTTAEAARAGEAEAAVDAPQQPKPQQMSQQMPQPATQAWTQHHRVGRQKRQQ